jgi:CRP-like cAMP-binding protein
MFFIKSGQVEIVGDSGQVFVTLGTGSFFGEIALFKSKIRSSLLIDCKRTAGARAKVNLELCMLSKDDYNFILNQFPIISERIQRTIKEREENEARKKAEEAARKAEEDRKKLEEEKEVFAKLERAALSRAERRPKSGIFGSIASLASSIMSKENRGSSKYSTHLHAPAMSKSSNIDQVIQHRTSHF